MDFAQVLNVTQFANALALASLLTMLSTGLALIYGLRGVLNFGHGILYTLGAYAGHSIARVTNFWAALILAPLALAALGVAFEYGVLRPLRERSAIDLAIVTYGIALVIGQLVLAVYGGDSLTVNLPASISGSFNLLGSPYPTYRLFLIVVGLGTCLALAAWLKWSRSGMHVRAVSQRREVSLMMGVNIDRLSLLVVCLGTGFAGLAGVLAGPYLSVEPAMGEPIFIGCLIIVVIGGLGSIAGAVLAAVIYGFIQVMGAVLVPELAVLAPYVLLVVVLLWRPQGIMKLKGR